MRRRRLFCLKSANRICRPDDCTKNTVFVRWAAGECITGIPRRMRFSTRLDSTIDLAQEPRVLHHFLCDFGLTDLPRRWKSSYEISLNRDRFLCYFLTVQ